jgi:hypothetical protein
MAAPYFYGLKGASTMNIRERIFELLEQEEQRSFLARQKKELSRERFERERNWFHDHVWIPLIDDLCEYFGAFGRVAEVYPRMFRHMEFFPHLRMSMPDLATLRYSVEILKVKDKFLLKRFLSVHHSDDTEGVSRSPYKWEFLNELSDVTKDNLEKDFLLQYEKVVSKRKRVPE